MKFEQATMTPTYAQRLLAGNIGNRPMNDTFVRDLVGRMRRGEWADNAETVKVGTDGRLKDGQHRLQAVVDSGCTVPMTVVYGVDPEAFKTIDVGRSRTAGNLLAMKGHGDGRTLAATAAMVWRYKRAVEGGTWTDLSKGTPSPDQMFAVIELHPELSDHIAWAKVARRKIGGGSPSVLATALLLCQEASSDAYTVWNDVALGANIPIDSPLLLARQALVIRKQRGGLSLPEQSVLMCKLLKAWNMWGRGETVQQLVWKHGIERIPVALKPQEWITWAA